MYGKSLHLSNPSTFLQSKLGKNSMTTGHTDISELTKCNIEPAPFSKGAHKIHPS